MCLNQVKVVKD